MAHAVPPVYWQAAQTILHGLGIRPTTVNLKLLVSWFVRERGWTNLTHNPLDSVLRAPGSTPLPGNPAGVQVYPTLTEGLRADTETLQAAYYAPLRAALRTSDTTAWFSATTPFSYALCGAPYCAGTPAYLAGMRSLYDQLPTPPAAYLKAPGSPNAPIPNPVLLAALAVVGLIVVVEAI